MNRGSTTWLVVIPLMAALFTAVITSALLFLASLGSDVRPRGDFLLALVNALLVSLAVVLSVVGYRASKDRLVVRAQTQGAVEERYRHLLKHIEDIFKIRTGLTKQFLKQYTDEITTEDYSTKAGEFLKFVANETRVLFDEFTNHDCAVSVKLIVPPPPGEIKKVPFISTYLRDTRSNNVRREIDERNPVYPFESHSPFVDILEAGEGQDYFTSNDLKALHKLGKYSNGNNEWPRLYNAALVVPIKDPSALPRESIIGFLCIDSKSAQFDNTACVSVARTIATTIYYVIYSLSVLDYRAKEEPQRKLRRKATE